MRTPIRLSDDGGDQSMDDILASIRRIIAEEPLTSRPVPRSLHDAAASAGRPLLARSEPTIGSADDQSAADDHGNTRASTVLPVMNGAADDDLFEPDAPQTDYVSPRPPRDLIFRPTASPIYPMADGQTALRDAADSVSPKAAPTDVNVATFPTQKLNFEADVVPPPGPEIIAAGALAASSEAIRVTSIETNDREDFDGVMDVEARVAPIIEPSVTNLNMEPLAASETEAALDRSVEDLLGALAAGLAQQVPSTPSAAPTEQAELDDAIVTAAPVESDVSDDAARRTVAEALAAIAGANNGAKNAAIPAVDGSEHAALIDAIAAAAQATGPVAAAVAETTVTDTVVVEGPQAASEQQAVASDAATDTPVAVIAVDERVGATLAPKDDRHISVVEAVGLTMPLAEPSSPPVANADASGAAVATGGPVIGTAAPGIDDAVTALLRPLIKDWLDRNMPTLVEKALKDELKSRGGTS